MLPTLQQAKEWYKDADPVHNFEHVLRVYQMAEQLAAEAGADTDIVLAAALLHDADGSAPGAETRGSHHHRSAAFAAEVLQELDWSEERIAAVQHCIRAHRFRSDGEAPETVEAQVLFDADKLDVLGAIGVARVISYAVLNNQPIFADPSEQFLKSGEKVAGEPHSAYHEYLFKLSKIKDRLYLRKAQAVAQERDQYLRSYFERLSAELSGNA